MSIPLKKARLRKNKRDNHVEQVKSVRAKRKEMIQRVESLEQRVQKLVRPNLSPSSCIINSRTLGHLDHHEVICRTPNFGLDKTRFAPCPKTPSFRSLMYSYQASRSLSL